MKHASYFLLIAIVISLKMFYQRALTIGLAGGEMASGRLLSRPEPRMEAGTPSGGIVDMEKIGK